MADIQGCLLHVHEYGKHFYDENIMRYTFRKEIWCGYVCIVELHHLYLGQQKGSLDHATMGHIVLSKKSMKWHTSSPFLHQHPYVFDVTFKLYDGPPLAAPPHLPPLLHFS